MQCCSMLCCPILCYYACCATLFYAVLGYAALCYDVLGCARLCCAKHYYAISSSAALCLAMQCYAVQCYATQCCPNGTLCVTANKRYQSRLKMTTTRLRLLAPGRPCGYSNPTSIVQRQTRGGGGRTTTAGIQPPRQEVHAADTTHERTRIEGSYLKEPGRLSLIHI